MSKYEGIFFKLGGKWDLECFLRDWNEFAANTEFRIVVEYFCEIGMNLRLRQNLEVSWNIFANLGLDLQNFFPKRREKRNWT